MKVKKNVRRLLLKENKAKAEFELNKTTIVTGNPTKDLSSFPLDELLEAGFFRCHLDVGKL